MCFSSCTSYKFNSFLSFYFIAQEDPFDAESHPLPDLVSEASLEFFQSDPFVDSKWTFLGAHLQKQVLYEHISD